MQKVVLHQGDVLEVLRGLPSELVHCVVTSPPYWGLRDYGVPGQLGLEKTPEEYIEKMVLVFREVRRVLQKDGTLWLNMGDSYMGSGGAGGDYGPGGLREGQPPYPGRKASKGPRGGSPKHSDPFSCPAEGPNRFPIVGLKAKDLCGMPWRLALALQADGWWLRSDIIWSKPNPMPESCTDRPTTAHEHIFLLTKSGHYFYDQGAVRELSVGQNAHDLTGSGYHAPGQSPQTGRRVKAPDGWATHSGGHGSFHKDGREAGAPAIIRYGRNLRSVWTIATAPFPEAHFATFPPALPERCIKAGTSEKGCCPQCGAPWKRVVDKVVGVSKECPKTQAAHEARGGTGNPTGTVGKSGSGRIDGYSTTSGWTPTCVCKEVKADSGFSSEYGGQDTLFTGPYEPIPCTVLDSFAGAGTTGLVAAKLGRNSVLIELNPEYCRMAEKRLKKELGMLAEVGVI